LERDDPVVSVVLTGDERIRELNAEWRGEDAATDVLSFPMHAPDELDDPSGPPILSLGDIVISLEYADRLVETQDHQQRVAEELEVDPATLDWDLADECEFLFIHGLLHLVGYDHADDQQEASMKAMERRLWES
jgi:probable rRNA maturation factor